MNITSVNIFNVFRPLRHPKSWGAEEMNEGAITSKNDDEVRIVLRRQGENDIIYRNKNGDLHRIGGPARIFHSKYRGQEGWVIEWFLEGKRFRHDGPCIIEYECDVDGTIQYKEKYHDEI